MLASDKQDQFDINISEVFSRLVQNRVVIAFFFILALSIATFLSYRQVDYYESQLLMQVDSNNTINQDMLNKVSGWGRSSDPVISQIFLIQSRYILEPVIEKLGLNVRAQYAPKSLWQKYFKNQSYILDVKHFDVPEYFFKKKFFLKIDRENHLILSDENHNQILAGFFQKTLKDVTGNIVININRSNAPVGSEFILLKQTSLSMVNSLAQHFKITQLGFAGNQSTGILQCSLRGKDIDQTINILNTIAKYAEQQDIKKRSQEASQTLAFLTKQLPITKGQLEDAEYRLNQYRSKSGKINIKMQSQMLLQKIVLIDESLEKLELKKIKMLHKYTQVHPAYKHFEQQIAAIKKQKMLIENQLKKVPAEDQIAINLFRDVSVKKMLYMVFLSKIQELEVIQAGTLSNLHILTSASRPESPMPGKANLYYLFAVIIATFISIFYVILKELVHPKIEDPQWLEKRYSIANLAIIPYSKEQVKDNELQKTIKSKGLLLLAQKHPRHLTVEALRSMRTNIQVNLATSHNNVIGILGIAPGVGKSFISVNIAYLMAAAGKKTLLIDGDLRKGTMHRYLNISPHFGLSEYLNQTISLEQATKKNVYPNLDVIVRGEYPNSPSELLMTNHFKDLITHVSKEYDVVIFDTAPVLMVTDGLIVGGLAANNYLVLGSRAHDAHDVDVVINRLKTIGVDLKGSIFNFNRPSSIIQGSYGKYSRYGGYYKYYKAYYADEKA